MDVAAPRDPLAYRDAALDPSFSLARHLGKVLGVAAVILAGGVWLARDATAWQWALLPVFWAVANVFEWFVHRFPMHRPLQPRILYLNHAIHHHRAFDGAAQEIRTLRDLSVVMMPWYTLVFVFGLASPIAIVAALVGGPALAGVFLVAAVLYFLLYEVIHTLHHLSPAQLAKIPFGRSGPVAALRSQHHAHHQIRRMTEINFNVTFPLADKLFGTYERAGTK
jgi:sterol desaturase/sphingolipid hydroxylase (fatty acid hydroxylase superfamily)